MNANMTTGSAAAAVRYTRRIYGFATTHAAWSFSKMARVEAGFPALRPNAGGLYEVEVLVRVRADIEVADNAAATFGGDLLRLSGVRVVWQVTDSLGEIDAIIASFPVEADAVDFSRTSNAAAGARSRFSVIRSMSVGGHVAV